MLRREFLRLATMTSTTLAVSKRAGHPSATADPEALTQTPAPQQALFKLFTDPPKAYRPMVRWWWNGDRVTTHELLRELDIMQQACIGGVEINPIRFPQNADPLNTQPLTYLSDEWIDAVKAVFAGTRERGMVCDMIVGSGWPYGGEFLSREDQTQMIALGTRDVHGPATLSLTHQELLADIHPRFVSPYPTPLKELMSVALVPYELSAFDQVTSIPLNNDAPVHITVPAGPHVVYFLVKLTGFMAVINGAPGASGPVLDHYKASAVSRYLTRISDRLTAKLGPLQGQLRAFFTDSIELEGANWTDDMAEQFKTRRGYDLAPFLPFVLFKVGEMGNAVATPYGAQLSPALKQQAERVRYDFETLKRELFNERFVTTFARWCTSLGVKSRMQAYGMECDPIAAGMLVDIPEGETWIHTEKIEPFGTGTYTQGRSYSISNKFVSSAAHLSGKRLISCEEMTNTEDPFHCTLERIKVAGDQSILSGVTQSVLHGFNYSPLAAPFPGWVRYGTFFNERNTWWPYFHLWTMYKARLSAVFQMADMQADIGILTPQADLASRYGFQRDPFPQIAYPPYVFKLWEAVHQNGSGCDYLSEDILVQSTVSVGRLHFNSRSYKALMLARVDSVKLSTAEKLKQFVEHGGTLIFLDTVPHQSDGLAHAAAESAHVADIITALRAASPARTPLVSVQEEDLVSWYRNLQQRLSLTPDVVISEPRDFISQIHYRHQDLHLFFFSHNGPQGRHSFSATFPSAQGDAWLWNAETGQRTPLSRDPRDGSLHISLDPSESQLIVFDPTAPAPTSTRKASLQNQFASTAQSQTLSGPWRIRLQGVDGSDRTLTLENPFDLVARPDTKDFAGTITYSLTFHPQGDVLPSTLALGRVRSISVAKLNGQPLGTRWYGEHTYDLAGKVKQGSNELVIEVITTLGNYMKSLKSNAVAQEWTANTPVYPIGLLQPPQLRQQAGGEESLRDPAEHPA